MTNDRGTLLPSSTKASSEDDNGNDLNNSGQQLTSSGTIELSGRHLPPEYVDIQEEIDQNLEEINTQSKSSRIHTHFAISI